MEASESQPDSVESATSEPTSASPTRLVIRVILPTNAPPPATVPQRSKRGALMLMLGLAAFLLVWLGISVFRPDPSSTPAVGETATDSSASAVIETRRAADSDRSRSAAHPARGTEAANATSTERSASQSPTPDVTGAQPLPDAPPSPINEVIPDVPRSALQTIRGTVRVAIRVTIGADGAVLAATSDDPGPSRYFERLSLEAAKQWTFTPSSASAERSMVLHFHYTREGPTVRASSPNDTDP